MKPVSILLFTLLFFYRLSGQEYLEQPLHIQTLPANGISLEKGWKYHAGDNAEWATPDFDDHNWTYLNINQPAAQLPHLTKNNIGWLRLWFSTDATLQDTMLALLINQYGASEIYMDGQLVQRLGTLSSKKIIGFNPHNKPIPLRLSEQPVHLLAIRFACLMPSSNWILKKATVAPLMVKLQSLTLAINNLQTEMKQSRVSTGIMVINAVFGLFFLLIFLFFRRQSLNLFFGVTNISLALNNYSLLFYKEGQYGLSGEVFLQLGMDYAGRIIGSSVMVFILLALFQRVHPFLKWFLVYLLTVDFVFTNLFPVQYSFVMYCMHLAVTLIFLWLTIRAFQNYNLKNWFIGIMAACSFFVNLEYFIFLIWGMTTPFFTIIFPIVTLPSMIIYLSLKYANVNTSLEKQLIQVKKLSEENLRSEQEKQQILANQNELLENQVANRTAELKQSLEELKATQSQLVQREKMASLGELTAGIAHEIQNPLNFVNNFSEVNKELMDEMKLELQAGNTNEVLTIANNIEENERKINHHGRRADAIVKGMLQHSRASTGKKEPTDINVLVDEYLRLSYHGVKAKDKDFNATIKTDFDATIGEVNIVPQDIGRVLLNLFNNAFYVVNEKKKSADENYEPTVSVSTKKENNKVIIIVRDNGTGIPQKIVDKIFQPFFTTKPTGQGTGLGLSLSYDIIKAHGGEIKVETKEGEGSTFIIQLS